MATIWLPGCQHHVVSPQGQGQGETLSHQPGRPALRAGHLRLLREPRGAGQLLREARTLPEDETALPRDPRAPGALQYGRWSTRSRLGGISCLRLRFICLFIQQTFLEHLGVSHTALRPTAWTKTLPLGSYSLVQGRQTTNEILKNILSMYQLVGDKCYGEKHTEQVDKWIE